MRIVLEERLARGGGPAPLPPRMAAGKGAPPLGDGPEALPFDKLDRAMLALTGLAPPSERAPGWPASPRRLL